jgi:hypothetical protein
MRPSTGLSYSNYRPLSYADEDDENGNDNGAILRSPGSSPSSHPRLDCTDTIVDDAYETSWRPTMKSKAPQPSTAPQPEEEAHGKHYWTSPVHDASLTTHVVLGEKVEHKSLDWGGSFPGSHDFYRTRDAPDEEVFILKPKSKATVSSLKRTRLGKDSEATKRPRHGSLERHISPNLRPLTTRDTTGSLTPQPEGGITYRY